jgi:hypothetical protein
MTQLQNWGWLDPAWYKMFWLLLWITFLKSLFFFPFPTYGNFWAQFWACHLAHPSLVSYSPHMFGHGSCVLLLVWFMFFCEMIHLLLLWLAEFVDCSQRCQVRTKHFIWKWIVRGYCFFNCLRRYLVWCTCLWMVPCWQDTRYAFDISAIWSKGRPVHVAPACAVCIYLKFS